MVRQLESTSDPPTLGSTIDSGEESSSSTLSRVEMTEPEEPTLAGVMTMMATMLKRVEELDVVREAEARVERRERQAERNIEKLPAMAEGADLELYNIQSFENDLAQAGICREKWKSYLTPRLPPSL